MRGDERSLLWSAFYTDEFTTAQAANLLGLGPDATRNLLNAMPGARKRGEIWRLSVETPKA
jgi:hypothetical protein